MMIFLFLFLKASPPRSHLCHPVVVFQSQFPMTNIIFSMSFKPFSRNIDTTQHFFLRPRKQAKEISDSIQKRMANFQILGEMEKCLNMLSKAFELLPNKRKVKSAWLIRKVWKFKCEKYRENGVKKSSETKWNTLENRQTSKLIRSTANIFFNLLLLCLVVLFIPSKISPYYSPLPCHFIIIYAVFAQFEASANIRTFYSSSELFCDCENKFNFNCKTIESSSRELVKLLQSDKICWYFLLYHDDFLN